MEGVYGGKPIRKRSYGLPRSTACQKRKAEVEAGEVEEFSRVLVEAADGDLCCPVRLKTGQRVTISEDVNLSALVPKVNQPYQFFLKHQDT